MFALTHEPILAQPHAQPSSGGFVAFEGKVRDLHAGREVVALEYEAYSDLAVAEGSRILETARVRFGCTSARAVHRLGRLAVGETAILIEVAAPGRRAAFAACEFALEEIKRTVPIWKKEFFADGESEWVNADHGSTSAISADGFYSRQMRLAEVGPEGQERLARARVAIVGVGGLGCPAAMHLAGAGIGSMLLVDGDVVALENLHRQPLFGVRDIGLPKAQVAADALRRLNPFVTVEAVGAYADEQLAREIVRQVDLVLDCTDSLAAKFMLNDACVKAGTTLVQAAVHRYEGHIQVIDSASGGPCLRCEWRVPPPEDCVETCAQVGVFGAVVGTIGAWQATEALMHILRLGTRASHELLLIDLLSGETQRVRRRRNPNCPLCGTGDEPLWRDYEVDIDDAARGSWHVLDLRPAGELGPIRAETRLMLTSGEALRIAGRLDPDLRYLVVCEKGISSGVVARHLREAGLRRARSLRGGLASGRVAGRN